MAGHREKEFTTKTPRDSLFPAYGCKNWGFTPRLCRPYRAQTKGKVASGVKYAGKAVWVRECGSQLEAHYGGERVAVHGKAMRKHELVNQAEHHQGIPLGARRRQSKTLIHLRDTPPVVEIRSLAAYESAARGGEL